MTIGQIEINNLFCQGASTIVQMTVGQSAFGYTPETTVIATTIGQKSNSRITIGQNDGGYGIFMLIEQLAKQH